MSINVSKAAVLLAALVAVTVLGVVGAIDGQALTGLLGSIVGYGVGNGMAAMRDLPSLPVVQRRSSD